MADDKQPWITRDIGWSNPLQNIMQEAGQFMAGMGGYGPQLAQMQQQAAHKRNIQHDFGVLSKVLQPDNSTAGQKRLQAVGEGNSPLPNKQGEIKTQSTSAEQRLLQAMGQMKTKEGLSQSLQMYNQAVKRKKSKWDTYGYYIKDENNNWIGRQVSIPKSSYNKMQDKLISKYGKESVSFGNKPEMAEGGETPNPWETKTFKSDNQLVSKVWNPNKQTWETKSAPRWQNKPEPNMKLNQWYNEAMPYLESLYGEHTAEGGFNVNPAKRDEYINAANTLDQLAKKYNKYGPIEAANIAMRQAHKKFMETKSGEGGKTTSPTISTKIVEKAIGPASTVKQFINNTLGAVTPGQKFPETEKARNKVHAFNQTMRGLLAVSARGAKFDIENINKYLPNPDQMWKDPDAAKTILQNLNDHINTTIESKKSILANKKLPADEAGRLTEDINKLQTALDYIPNKKELEQDRNLSNITITDIMGMDKSKLKNLDVDNLSDEQVRAVKTRVNQLGEKNEKSEIEKGLAGMPPGEYRDKKTDKIYKWDGKTATEVK